MGQISLARFNRLNVSMTWESELKTNAYHWLSTKLYLFLNLYITRLFQVNQYNFFNLWAPKIKINVWSEKRITNFTRKLFATHDFSIAIIKNPKKLLNVLACYLFRIFDNSFIYVIYNHFFLLKTLFKNKGKASKKFLLVNCADFFPNYYPDDTLEYHEYY